MTKEEIHESILDLLQKYTNDILVRVNRIKSHNDNNEEELCEKCLNELIELLETNEVDLDDEAHHLAKTISDSK